uniref:Uncharacterized protein n=1 Tax=Opuntia streptacantha TaxID=393608 RepID=A0A7C9AC01_OPUST
MDLILTELLQSLSLGDRMKQLQLHSHSMSLLQVVDFIFLLVFPQLKGLRWLRFLLHQLQKFLIFLLHHHLSKDVHLAIQKLPFFPQNFLLLDLQQETPQDRFRHQYRHYHHHLLIKIVHILCAQSHLLTLLPDQHVVVSGQCKLGCALAWLYMPSSLWFQSWLKKLLLGCP